MLLRLSALAAFLFAFSAQALVLNDETIPYYGLDFYAAVHNNDKNEDLIADLRKVLVSKHMRGSDKGFDRVGDKCESGVNGCYEQNPIGYSAARKVLLGKLHLVDQGSEYGIKEVYCQRVYGGDDFPPNGQPGPNVTVDDKILNVEHTWPQSRFSSKYKADIQKCDLHHLFPTDSKLNSIRGNFKFGEVDGQKEALKCAQSKFGTVQGRGQFFEPPTPHKGNVARALFYFSVRYQIAIDPQEEAFLRKWSKLDPVDAEEKTRNTEIQKIQGNRNPFIDFPELVDQISNF